MSKAFAMQEADPGDMDEIRRLLERNGLPTADLDRSQPFFLVAREGETLLGAAGLEVYGTTGLLRSIVIADKPTRQGTWPRAGGLDREGGPQERPAGARAPDRNGT